MSYSEEDTARMIEIYLAAVDKEQAVIQIAEDFNKPKKSVISKLSKERVYVKKEYKTKQGSRPITKKEMIFNLSLLLDIDPNSIQGLEKTPKMELQYLINIITDRLVTITGDSNSVAADLDKITEMLN